MLNSIDEKSKSVVEVYTKHIEVSTQILQSIRNLTIDIKQHNENFKSIEKNFNKVIEELDFLKLYVERSLKVHDSSTAGRFEKLQGNNNETKDDFKKFYITFSKAVEMLKFRISFVYLGGVGIIIALIGLLIRSSSGK
jgi:hypothetical protein